MIITKISIPDSVITNGLKTISMNKLQQVVLLTGKNGSGKSRLLNQIANMFGQKPIKSELIQLKSSIESYETATKNQYASIEHLEQAISTVIQPEQIASFRQQIDQCRLNIQHYDQQLSQWYQRLRWNYIETDAEAEKYIAIPFVPKNLNIRDCSNDGSNNLQSIADTASNIGVNNLHESSFAKIQVIQNRWFSVTHPMSTVSAEEKKEAIEEYTRLKEIIRIFLNSEVDRNINDQATLFGFPLGQANLSDGQKIILQYCIALHSQGISLKEHILLLDEPDNHLHPSIIIEMIERIISYNPDGQIWIATHSIPLLSYFDPQCIWYLEQGVVSRGLKITEKVLSSLLGNESQIEKLKDFINLPAIQAISRFAFESLFPPKAVVTDCSDPQTIQVHTEIEQQIRPAGKIKILDFGAGKCRLLSGYDGDIKQFKEQIDYYAFDATLSDKQECINAIARIYEEDSDKRHYSQILPRQINI